MGQITHESIALYVLGALDQSDHRPFECISQAANAFAQTSRPSPRPSSP